MKIEELFKKKNKFGKPAMEKGIAVSVPWHLFLLIYFILLVGACALGYYIFNFTTAERTGVYTPEVTVGKKVDATKSATVLEFFQSREEKTNIYKTVPPKFIDPSN